MPDRIVVNTGPLIALAVSDALFLLEALPYEFLVPRQVQEEIEDGNFIGHKAVSLRGARVVDSDEKEDPVIVSLLDKGEASVIQYALKKGVRTVCIDEKKGRNLARAVNLEVVGTLGLLLKAKKLGMVPEIAPILARLTAFGIWYNPALLERVLLAAKESQR
jgi:predicted nucleic acid-binding protein